MAKIEAAIAHQVKTADGVRCIVWSDGTVTDHVGNYNTRKRCPLPWLHVLAHALWSYDREDVPALIVAAQKCAREHVRDDGSCYVPRYESEAREALHTFIISELVKSEKT
jgi:hypothetical protein